MGKPTTEELRRMFSQISVKRHMDDIPATSSSVVVATETAASEPSQLTNMQVPAEADEMAACLEGAAAWASLKLAADEPEALAVAAYPTASPSGPKSLVNVCSLSRSPSEGGYDSEDPSSSYNFTETKMCTPRMAKELSASHPGIFIRITTRDPDNRIQEEDDCADGMRLSGFHTGIPLYCSLTSLGQDLLAIQTRTILGLQYVEQPIESCLGKTQQAEKGTQAADDDSGCYTEEQTEKPAVESLPPNRTFSNKWLAVGKSCLGGFGMFAASSIPKFTHILLEHPFLTITQYKFLEGAYRALDQDKKAVFDGLHGYHKHSDDPWHQKWNANHFYLSGSEGVLAIASNFNHACKSRRNTQYYWDNRRNVMTFTTTRDIAKGEEILISYGENRRHLFVNFGFVCHCGGCEDEEWEPLRSEFWQF